MQTFTSKLPASAEKMAKNFMRYFFCRTLYGKPLYIKRARNGSVLKPFYHWLESRWQICIKDINRAAGCCCCCCILPTSSTSV